MKLEQSLFIIKHLSDESVCDIIKNEKLTIIYHFLKKRTVWIYFKKLPIETPSTRSRIFLKLHMFLRKSSFRPHETTEFALPKPHFFYAALQSGF